MDEQQRITAWSMEGREILASVRKYEDEHPQGALCLHPLLMVMDQCTQAHPEPGACDRPGCPVLHDDPAHPIHPDDLTTEFHERTGRCVAPGLTSTIHAECAGIELQHRTGNHNACLLGMECPEKTSAFRREREAMPVQDEERFISPTVRAVGMLSVPNSDIWLQRLDDGGSEALPLLWAMSDGTLRWKV